MVNPQPHQPGQSDHLAAASAQAIAGYEQLQEWLEHKAFCSSPHSHPDSFQHLHRWSQTKAEYADALLLYRPSAQGNEGTSGSDDGSFFALCEDADRLIQVGVGTVGSIQGIRCAHLPEMNLWGTALPTLLARGYRAAVLDEDGTVDAGDIEGDDCNDVDGNGAAGNSDEDIDGAAFTDSSAQAVSKPSLYLPKTVVYVNLADLTELHPQAKEWFEQGISIVNAPRPIPGDAFWQGDFRHGIFYTAGQYESFVREWESLDAWVVQPITNQQVVAVLTRYANGYGKSLSDTLRRRSIRELAQSIKPPLPWCDRPEIKPLDLLDLLKEKESLTLEQIIEAQPPETYGYTEYAVSAQTLAGQALHSLIDWGYAEWDEGRKGVVCINQ